MIDINLIRVEKIGYVRQPQLKLTELSFTLQAGECLALLGTNGTGKTTTLNLLAGLIQPDRGSIWIKGLNIKTHKQAAKRQIGFLPDRLPLYHDLTVQEYLKFISQLRQIPKPDIKEAIEYAIEEVELKDYRHHLIGILSKGLKQRVGIAQAIIHRPPILLLDEPTQGLDGNQIDRFQRLLTEYKKEAAIILSTHYVNEIENICNKIIQFSTAGNLFYDFNHCTT